MIEIPWSERNLSDILLTHHQPLDDDAEDTVTDADWEENRDEEEEEEGGRPLRHPFPRYLE